MAETPEPVHLTLNDVILDLNIGVGQKPITHYILMVHFQLAGLRNFVIDAGTLTEFNALATKFLEQYPKASKNELN